MADGQSIIVPAEIPVVTSKNGRIPPAVYDMDVNYSAQNQWFCYLPIEDILGPTYKNLNLHLTRFSLPQLETSSMDVSYKGYQKTIPGKVLNPGSKELTLEYIVDDRWENYKSLFQWISAVYGMLNPTATVEREGIHPTDYLPMRIYLLDNYKRKVIQFLFSDCWIHVFNDLALDVANSGEVHHSFQICYDTYSIEDISGQSVGEVH